MLIGYARVSTQDQNLELQREALSKAGCKKVFEDKVSGTRADRPGLAKTLEMLREGDTLVVWKLDRLGRSVKQLVDLVGDLHKHGVQFRSLTDSIDTGTPSGRFFFHVMASLAEMERELTVERTRAGLEVATARPQRRPQAEDDRQQDRVGQEAAGQRGAAQGRGQEPRRVHSDAVPLGASLHARLAWFIFRFLRRPNCYSAHLQYRP
jgi:DNA invertase Pin-like site-specific DNA recombinase